MAYSYVTATEALAALDARLYNQTFQFWTSAELLLCLREALRTFNAMAQFWRAEMVFPTVANQWWYDLPSQVASICPYTVTQLEIIQLIQHHLLEPANTSYPLTWTGSTQFTMTDLLVALQRRQDDTLGTTGCIITRSTVAAALTTRTTLTDASIDIRRLAWLPDNTYTPKPINQSDFWAERAFDPGWTTPPAEPPSNWMQNTEPPISFDVDRVPPVSGQWDVLTVDSGSAFSASASALMSLPDDWTWVAKYGALSDLLSRESPAKDIVRAEYCKQRYQEGLALLETAPLVLALRLNNIPMAVDAVVNADAFDPDWQGEAAGQPTRAFTTRNLIAFAPKPDSVYSATVSCCQNAPVPSVGGDYIQIAKDCYDSILDLSQHIAAFKLGGQEFLATIPLYQKAQRKAAQYNSKLKEMGFFEMPQLDLSQNNEMQNARYIPGAGPRD